MIREQDFLFKLVIVGNQGVGKSSLFIRFCDDNFVDNYLPTIGVDFRFKMIEV
jgi:GTPase SAR1 family protein